MTALLEAAAARSHPDGGGRAALAAKMAPILGGGAVNAQLCNNADRFNAQLHKRPLLSRAGSEDAGRAVLHAAFFRASWLCRSLPRSLRSSRVIKQPTAPLYAEGCSHGGKALGLGSSAVSARGCGLRDNAVSR